MSHQLNNQWSNCYGSVDIISEDHRQAQQEYLYRQLLGAQQASAFTLGITPPYSTMRYTGNRYLIVCNGAITEMAEGASDAATQERAEQLAHQHQSEAFILKPIRKVAPKRDVVTTEL